MQKKLGIFLLSYKRPALIGETVDSILNQDYKNFDLIISENSPDQSVFNVIEKYSADPRVKIIKRTPSLPSLSHFNTILNEALEYEFAMLFHDDDVLLSSALTKMINAIENQKDSSAVSCNAYFIKENVPTNLLFNPNLQSDTRVSTQSELINRYVFKRLSHTAFPAYIYRTSFLKGLKMDPQDGGKYSDVSFLVKLVGRGPFFWLSEPLVGYRLHSNNDSASVNLPNILSLSRFFLKTAPQLVFTVSFYISKQVVKKFILTVTGLKK